MPTPYTQGYNLTLQYQLGRNDTVQLGYVGNTVHHLGTYVNPNTPREILPPGLDALRILRILIFRHTWSIPLFQAIATTTLSKPTTNDGSATA